MHIPRPPRTVYTAREGELGAIAGVTELFTYTSKPGQELLQAGSVGTGQEDGVASQIVVAHTRAGYAHTVAGLVRPGSEERTWSYPEAA